jgi:hypothetical protein
MIPSDPKDDVSADLSECAQGKLAVKPKRGSGEPYAGQSFIGDDVAKHTFWTVEELDMPLRQ